MEDFVLVEASNTTESGCGCRSYQDLLDISEQLERKAVPQSIYESKDDARKSLVGLFSSVIMNVRSVRKRISNMLYSFSTEQDRMLFVDKLASDYSVIFEDLFSQDHDSYQHLSHSDMKEIMVMCHDLVASLTKKNECHHCVETLHALADDDDSGLISHILTSL